MIKDNKHYVLNIGIVLLCIVAIFFSMRLYNAIAKQKKNVAMQLIISNTVNEYKLLQDQNQRNNFLLDTYRVEKFDTNPLWFDNYLQEFFNKYRNSASISLDTKVENNNYIWQYTIESSITTSVRLLHEILEDVIINQYVLRNLSIQKLSNILNISFEIVKFSELNQNTNNNKALQEVSIESMVNAISKELSVEKTISLFKEEAPLLVNRSTKKARNNRTPSPQVHVENAHTKLYADWLWYVGKVTQNGITNHLFQHIDTKKVIIMQKHTLLQNYMLLSADDEELVIVHEGAQYYVKK